MKLFAFLLAFCLSSQATGQTNRLDLSTVLSGGKTYGAYCGFAGKHPETRILVEALIAQEDVPSLEEWLSSPNLVVQTYAVEGLVRLFQEGVSLKPETIGQINRVKSKNDLISTCKGCFYEQISMKDCLKEYNIE